MPQEECKEKILSEEYRDFMMRDTGALGENFPLENGCRIPLKYGFELLYIDQSEDRKKPLGDYPYTMVPKCYTTLDMAAIQQAGIAAVQNLTGLELSGEGVLVGIIDTGINYLDPIFRNLDGSTRIRRIWDQEEQSGTAPWEIGYGSEYTREQINLAIQSENPKETVPSFDTDGHGTFVASVACGGANPENLFIGAAPEAEMVIVKLKEAKEYLREYYFVDCDARCYQENDLVAAVFYLQKVQEELKRPLVICLAVGTSFGGHNGDSILADILDIYATVRNRCVVVGTGNEAARRHHYFNRFTDAQDTRTAEIRVGEGTQSFAVELWSTLPNIVMVSVTSPSGERTGMIPIRLGYLFDFLFTFERTTITVEYRLLQRNNDAQLVFIRFQNAVPGIWKIDIKPAMQTTGDFHIWLPMEEFLEGEVYFLESNPDTTFTEPSGGRNTMTVAFYNSRENGVDINSGMGYTRDEKIKPDYAAPGEAVTGAVPGGEFKNRTGSSAATAIAAGGCALIMEWISEQPGARGVSSSQVRNIIVMGTQKLPGIEYPNTQWGYGTMNLYRSLDILRQL